MGGHGRRSTTRKWRRQAQKVRHLFLICPRSSTVNEDVMVSRSITIIKRSDFRNISGETGSGSSSPSPTTPGGELRMVRRKSTSDACDRAQPRSPTVYDWEASVPATLAAAHDATLQFTLLNPYKGL